MHVLYYTKATYQPHYNLLSNIQDGGH